MRQLLFLCLGICGLCTACTKTDSSASATAVDTAQPVSTVQSPATVAPSVSAQSQPTAQLSTVDLNVGTAEELLLNVAATYRAATAMTDEISFELVTDGLTMKQTPFGIAIGPRSQLLDVSYFKWMIRVIDDTLYLERLTTPGKYMSEPLNGDLETTLRAMNVGFSLPTHHFALRRYTKINDIVNALAMGFFDNPRLVGLTAVPDSNGNALAEIEIRSNLEEKIKIRIDPTSLLIVSATATFIQEDFANKELTAILHYKTKLLDELPYPIRFNTAGRIRVDNVNRFVPNLDEPAKNFTLQTLDGDVVSLADLRGQVVILDFWATWCAPCRQGLPLLDKFARWAEETNAPVKVFAVNTLQRESTPGAKTDKAAEYWNKQNFSFPTFIDTSDLLYRGYGFGSIPQTVIIRPDGTVAEIHVGFKQDIVSLLKQATAEALGQSG